MYMYTVTASPYISLFFVSFRCVIAELFSEGTKLFDLSELLAYKKGDYDPMPSLEKIEDNQIRVGMEYHVYSPSLFVWFVIYIFLNTKFRSLLRGKTIVLLIY